MGFNNKKKEDMVDTSFVLSKDELRELDKMVIGYGGRQKLMVAHHAIRIDKDGSIIVKELSGAIGAKMGLGKHTYNTSYIYAWWLDAFRQLDVLLDQRAYAKREEIFQLTGEYPKLRSLGDIKLLEVRHEK